MSPAPRKSIGTFEIERELGHGGMGVVYLALQPALERRVVIKTLRRDLIDDPNLEARFRREAQAAAAIHHQNVVAVYDCFTWRGEHFISQEHVDGVDLGNALAVVDPIPPRVAALIALELTRGLEEIHARGIVHRDMKPSNVLLGRAGEVKVADFGVALDARGPPLTQTGFAVGTPAYMSPEQLRGERADARSDVFSLGTVLFEMVGGRNPFADSEPQEGEGLLRRMESGRLPSLRKLAPGTPRGLVRLIQACLRPKPSRRVPSSTALRVALEARLGACSSLECRREIAAWLAGQTLIEAEAGDLTQARVLPRRHWRRRTSWLAAACAVLAAAAVGLQIHDRLDPLSGDLLASVFEQVVAGD